MQEIIFLHARELRMCAKESEAYSRHGMSSYGGGRFRNAEWFGDEWLKEGRGDASRQFRFVRQRSSADTADVLGNK